MAPMPARADGLILAAALVVAVLPLWVSERLPMVDLPQHLHLISVLHRLDDPTTLFPDVFSARGTLTPYLGYYHLVSLLNWLLPLETANRVFLSVYVAGMAGGMAYLLRSLGRPLWPALLSLPFAYGDSFAWGFINYLSALPLTFLTLGLYIRVLREGPARGGRVVALALSVPAVLLFHVQAFGFLGLALPFLLFTVPVPGAGRLGLRFWLRQRAPALLAPLPGVVLFLVWIGGRLDTPAEVEAGAPWKAWGPVLSRENLTFKSLAQNARELPLVVANTLRDGTDRYAVYAAVALAVFALLLRLVSRSHPDCGPSPAARPADEQGHLLLGLGALALALYFLLPFDVHGYVYYVNTRYAHLALPLLLGAVPRVPARFERAFLLGGAACALVLAVPLIRGFRAFDVEAAPLERMAEATAARPRVMGLIFEPRSGVVRHPVYLHSAAELARLQGGLANFSFALTPHSPLRYRGTPPPTFPSEWRPSEFDFARHGGSYDHFLLRGRSPEQVLGPLLGKSLFVAAREGEWTLVRKR